MFAFVRGALRGFGPGARALSSAAPRGLLAVARPVQPATLRLREAGSLAASAAALAALVSLNSENDPSRAEPIRPSGARRVLCLHGINLNMFGKRDPKTYGTATLADIDDAIRSLGAQLGVEVECFQSNYEGELVERIHKAHTSGEIDAVIINAGAWTHYSYGLRDALAILKIPIVEVHMSNVHAREDMKGSQHEPIRHHSVISPLAVGVIAGFGLESYLLGLRAAVNLLG